jgi:hypothetical protein
MARLIDQPACGVAAGALHAGRNRVPQADRLARLHDELMGARQREDEQRIRVRELESEADTAAWANRMQAAQNRDLKAKLAQANQQYGALRATQPLVV